MAAQGDALRERLVGLLLANLDPADRAFLTRIAILDHHHPDLCCVVVQSGVTVEQVRLATAAHLHVPAMVRTMRS
jgi:LuxR family maltose regulon positive regulatory protein